MNHQLVGDDECFGHPGITACELCGKGEKACKEEPNCLGALKMTTTKHTPSPWTLGDENNQGCSVLMGTQHNLTCSLDRQDGNTGAFVIERSEMLANARLISASPDLLSALQEMIDYYGSASANVPALNQARAAIAKAVQA